MIEKRSYQREKARTRPKNEWGRWRVWLKSVWERERHFSIEKDQIKWEKISCWDIYRKHEAWWIKRCRALIFDRWSYQGAIERCPQQSDLDGSRSYPTAIEEIETFSMDWEVVEKLSRQILKNFDGLKFSFYTSSKTLNPTCHMGLGWIGISAENSSCMSFDRSSLIFDQSSLADFVQ